MFIPLDMPIKGVVILLGLTKRGCSFSWAWPKFGTLPNPIIVGFG